MRSRTARLAAVAGPAGGLVIVLVATSPPMHAAADASVAAHMIQHLVLILAAAPLLVLGHPGRVIMRMLPVRTRRLLARRAHRCRVGPRNAQVLALGAWAAHVVVLWAWHAPRLYDWAHDSAAVHVVEHASLIVTGCAFWWPVLSGRVLGPGAAVLYLFAAAGQGTALGALLALAESPWYASQAVISASGLTALEEQQLAGLIMWIPGGLTYTIVALAVLARTLRGAAQAVESRTSR